MRWTALKATAFAVVHLYVSDAFRCRVDEGWRMGGSKGSLAPSVVLPGRGLRGSSFWIFCNKRLGTPCLAS